MNGPFDQEHRIQISPIAGCRFSYTLNNYQPVRCSYIGDEPLFFMDVQETDADEGGLFDAELLEDLNAEMNAIGQKFSAYEALSKQFRQKDNHVAELFAESAFEICEPHSERRAQNPAFEAHLENSRYLKTLYEFAQGKNISVTYSRQCETADYDREGHTVLVNPDIATALQILSLARELRRVWQHKNGVLIEPTAFYPDQGVLVNRMQEADLTVAMIRTAWEMQLAGDKSVWIEVENSSLGDLGRAFAREACNDFRSINNGQAALGVIEAWFLSERCRKMDRKYIQRMLAGPVSNNFNSSEDISRQAAANLIYALGETPYGKNYLAGHVHFIMDDPIFCEIRDRANANFLWFIKFESSFMDAEQSLQEEGGVTSHAQNGTHTSSQPDYTQENEPKIIAFPPSGSATEGKTGKMASGGGNSSGTILPFGQL